MTTERRLADAPRLQRLARRAHAAPAAGTHGDAGRCELCAEPLPSDHRHLLELTRREVRCACRACGLLFDRQESGAGRFRLLPDRLWQLHDLALGDAGWRRLGVPVGTAFVVERSEPPGPVASYPSPLGLTESEPDAAQWRRVKQSHPALRTLEPDVEALLVHRRRDLEVCWIASLEICFRLAACIREHWSGMSGGDRVWQEIEREVDALCRRATPVGRLQAGLEEQEEEGA